MTTALYAAPLVALYLALSIRVALYRKDSRILLGDAGDPALVAMVRAHGNCAEYAPLGIVMLLLAELAHAPAPILHVAGLAVVAGRGLHAWAVGWKGPLRARIAGMALTFFALGLAALAALLSRGPV